jgi:hypothetical protein
LPQHVVWGLPPIENVLAIHIGVDTNHWLHGSISEAVNISLFCKYPPLKVLIAVLVYYLLNSVIEIPLCPHGSGLVFWHSIHCWRHIALHLQKESKTG